MQQRTGQIRDSFNLVVVATKDCFLFNEGEKMPNLLDEIRASLESELQVCIIQNLDQCQNIDEEISKCSDAVLRSCLERSMRYIYMDGCSDATVLSLLSVDVKTDDIKTPRTRAAGVASFKLNYKNAQAMELAEDGRLAIYHTALYDPKKIPGDVEGHIKALFEMYDVEKKGRITWRQFAEIDRLMVETLASQYSEMISRRIYSMMIYPGLTLESEISYTTFANYHSYIARQMGLFEGDSRDVGIHYKYMADKVKHMKKGKRFQKKFDLYVSHDRSKFSKEFAFNVQQSIREHTPNIRVVLGTDFDKKVTDSSDDKKKGKDAPKVEEKAKNEVPGESLNVLVLLRTDCLTKDVVKEEIMTGLAGGAQILVMCHIAKTPMLELEVKKAPSELQKVMSRLPVFCYSPDQDKACVFTMLEHMSFPDWKPTANASKTFRKNENPLVVYLFQRCEEDDDLQNALQCIANVTSPSCTNADSFGQTFVKDDGLSILAEKFGNMLSVPAVCEVGCRVVANPTLAVLEESTRFGGFF